MRTAGFIWPKKLRGAELYIVTVSPCVIKALAKSGAWNGRVVEMATFMSKMVAERGEGLSAVDCTEYLLSDIQGTVQSNYVRAAESTETSFKCVCAPTAGPAR
jgi:hypothetical protein